MMRREYCYFRSTWGTRLVSDVQPSSGAVICAGNRRVDPIVHRATDLCIVWVGGSPAGMLGRLDCATNKEWRNMVRFTSDLEAVGPECKVCSRADEPFAPHVYLARTPAGLKVGMTGQVNRRMAQLDGELLASAPGGRLHERLLIEALKPYRGGFAGREWFPDTPDVEAEARRLVAAIHEGATA